MEEVAGTPMFFENTGYKLGGYGKIGYDAKSSPKRDEPATTPSMGFSSASRPAIADDLYADMKFKVTTTHSQSNLNSNQEMNEDRDDAWSVVKSSSVSRSETMSTTTMTRVNNARQQFCDDDVEVVAREEPKTKSSTFGTGASSFFRSEDAAEDEESIRPRAYSDSKTGRICFPDDSRYNPQECRREGTPKPRSHNNKYLGVSSSEAVRSLEYGGWKAFHSQTDVGKFNGNVDENPLAAMLQKYAALSSSLSSASAERYPASALKPSNSIQANMFSAAQRLTPEKRQFHQQMMFSSSSPVAAASFGGMAPHPPSQTHQVLQSSSSEGVEAGGCEKGSSQHDLFCCHICTFMGTSEDDFRMHMADHFEYQCPHCTYSSRTEGRLKRHVREFHGDVDETANADQIVGSNSPHNSKPSQPKRFKCRQCKFISFSREEHWTHNRSHIKEEKQLQCPRCPFVTEFKHHLEYHIRNHVGSKPFKCSKCNYSCVNKSMLNSHMKSHTNVYQFRCANCKYATKYSHSLKLHLLKKKHMPAVVLNPDGSLPTDGSGSFDLVSKRGPPRGPRGPRRLKQKHVEPVSPPPVMLPMFSLDSGAKLSYTQGNNDYSWVQSSPTNGKQQQQLNGVPMPLHPSLPPVAAINVSALFPQDRAVVSQSLPYPLNMLNHLSSTVAPSLVSSFYHMDRVPSLPPVGSPSYKCSFCPAGYLSMSHLAQHVKMEHADKLTGFGIKLEVNSPPVDQLNPGAADRPQMTTERSTSLNYPDGVVDHPPALHSRSATKSSPARIDQKMRRDEEKQTGKKTTTRQDSSVEYPLDLSAAPRQSGEAKKKNLKRNAEDDEDNESVHRFPTAASPSSAGSAPGTIVSRKRSRKGKACKLDVISLKLQDRWADGSPMEEEDSSFDGSDFHQGLGSDSNEMERPFSEVIGAGGGAPSSPKTWNNDGVWKHKKKLAQQPLRKTSDDSEREKVVIENNEGGDHRRKNGIVTDQEPVNNDNSLSNDSKASESFASVRLGAGGAERRSPADKGYFMCQHCEMGFRDCVTYTLHMGYHGYNDPFQCNMCGDRSEDAVGFFVHIARVAHNGQNTISSQSK